MVPISEPNEQDLLMMGKSNMVRAEVVQSLEGRSFVGVDVSLLIDEDTDVPPGGLVESMLMIPKGYFQEISSLEEERFLLDRRVVGNPVVRSRACQAGVYVYRNDPLLNSGRPDIEEDPDHYRMHIRIHNANSANVLHLPSGEIAFARLCILGKRLMGNELVMLGKATGNDAVVFVSYNRGKYRVFPINDVKQLSANEIDALQILAIGLQLKKAAQFGLQRSIDLGVVLSQALKDRGQLDQYLGITWEDFDRDEVVRGAGITRFRLLQADRIHMPDGYILSVLDPAHAPATIIDANFQGDVRLESTYLNREDVISQGLPPDIALFHAYRV